MLTQKKTFVITCCVLIVASACGGSYKPAMFRVENANASLILEREPTHAFLAEYDRTLILLVNGKEKDKVKMFPDTGGYSRTNVYKVSDSIYVLRDAADSYEFNVDHQTLRKRESREVKGKFVGCFDTDDSREWRFIPVSERKETPAEFRTG